MKSILIFIFSILLIPAGYCQQKESKLYSLSLDSVSLEQAFSRIEDISGLTFAYNKKVLPDEYLLSFTAKSISLHQIMDSVLSGSCLVYEIKGKRIVVYESGIKGFTISGQVVDKESGECLIGAHVYDQYNSAHGCATNSYGFFSLSTHSELVQLTSSYVGYKKWSLELIISDDTVIMIKLKADPQIRMVEIKEQNIGQQINTSVITLQPNQLKYLPAFGGEKDIIRAARMMPGIQSGTEGTSGLAVRGGTPDQNLFLLDGVSLYNVSHLYGFLSVFNEDAIKQVIVIKGGFPAKYGGRLSSIFDVRMKEGNLYEHDASVSLGMISSKVMVNGPIVKGRSSYMFSARRSYLDILLGIPTLFSKNYNESKAQGYSLTDINGKINVIVSQNNRLFLSFYHGNDRYTNKYSSEYDYQGIRMSSEQKNHLKWGNSLGAVRWNHVYNRKLFSNTQLSVTQYNLQHSNSHFSEETDLSLMNPASFNQHGYGISYLSKISDFTGKTDFEFYLSNKHQIDFGGQWINYRFQPGIYLFDQVVDGQVIDPIISDASRYPSSSFDVYVGHKYHIPNGLFLNSGIRTGFYQSENKFFWTLEPRIAGGFEFPFGLKTQLAYTRMHQPLHILSNSGLGMPTDIWVPASKLLPPQKADQIALGLEAGIGKFRLSAEIYYKKFENLIAMKEGSSFLIQGDDWENMVLGGGKGKAYGWEFLVCKDQGRLTGWISYTLSWNMRQFEDINRGEWYFDHFDRRHDLAIVVNYPIKKNLILSANWVFMTGNPITLPETLYPYIHYPIGQNDLNRYFGNDEYLLEWLTELPRQRGELIDYGARNKYRMPNYHRLDFSLNFIKKKRKYTRTLSVGLYNAYSRLNPFYVSYVDDTSGAWPHKNSAGLKIVTLLPVLPSISWTFDF